MTGARRLADAGGRAARPGSLQSDADQATTALYHAHYRALTQLAGLLVDDVRAAEDVAQAAFVAMHGAWPRLGDSGKALSYLRRAVVSRARSTRRRAVSPPPPAQPATAAEAALVALRALPARQREALVLRYYMGLPDTEIALAMGLSTPAARSHITHGMASLQVVLTGRSDRAC